MDNVYNILFTCSFNNDIQINSIIQKLSEQRDHYNDTRNDDEKKNIKILICKDNIELYRKKDLLLHECNSPYYVFLDENDDVYDTYIEEFMLKWNNRKKNAVVTGCDSKYFKSCLTLISSLYKHSDHFTYFI